MFRHHAVERSSKIGSIRPTKRGGEGEEGTALSPGLRDRETNRKQGRGRVGKRDRETKSRRRIGGREGTQGWRRAGLRAVGQSRAGLG